MGKSMFATAQQRWLILGGLATSVLSLAIFHAGQVFANTTDFDLDPFFIANYAIAIGWLLVAVIYNVDAQGWRRVFKLSPPLYRIAMILFTISAFSLNRNLQIMGGTPEWVGVYLYVTYLALFLDTFAERLPGSINRIINFLAGMGVMLTLYYTILSLPALPFCVLGAIYFGLSLHMFAPLFALAGFLGVVRKRTRRDMRYSFVAGLFFPIVAVTAYTIQIQQIATDVDEVNQAYIASHSELPEAIFAGQYLKGRLFDSYIMQSDDRVTQFGGLFSITDINDPLAIIGQGFANRIKMPKSEREKVLAARTDLKHESQRRLWSDEHLITRHVETEAEIFPEFRLAYVEKIIDVEHYGVKGLNRRRWQEEAVYTFHLPEGAVATSLSLWVNGVERKSRFTTKSKADNAYATIVGRERRDPALLHWQEGNTLVVTVFPVSAELPRKFKLGVTVPLRMVNNSLVLENIYFEGPSTRFATEETHLRFAGDDMPQHIHQTEQFEHEGGRDWNYTGSYRPYWELSCAATPVSRSPFVFNGKSYRAHPWEPQLEKRNFQQVYLDLNQAWEEDEFLEVWKRIDQREVYTFDQKMIRLTPQNHLEVFRKAQDMQYSLFPFYEIQQPEHALIISKTADNYVEMSDVRESAFGHKLMKYLEQTPVHLAFYNIGTQLSPYLKSLREFKALNYASGDIPRLGSWLRRGAYPTDLDDPGKVLLHGTEMVIEQSDAEGPNPQAQQAPDHLLRLFAYNKTLARAGVCFLTNEDYADEIVKVAAEAFVVSPFTSLIVLETDHDYERFGIDSLENSLGNAFSSSKMAANNTGSVPEPHEWLLIILVLLFLSWTQRHRFANLRFR